MCLSSIKIKSSKMNMYKKYFYFYFSLIYYLVITSKKVNEYVKLKLPKMNL